MLCALSRRKAVQGGHPHLNQRTQFLAAGRVLRESKSNPASFSQGMGCVDIGSLLSTETVTRLGLDCGSPYSTSRDPFAYTMHDFSSGNMYASTKRQREQANEV